MAVQRQSFGRQNTAASRGFWCSGARGMLFRRRHCHACRLQPGLIARRPGMIINHAAWMVCGPSFSYEVLRFSDYEPGKDAQRGHALRFASDDLYDCRWAPSHEYKIPATARPGLFVGRIAYQWESKPHL